MDNRDEVRAFLTSRRGKITPEQAGLPVYGTRRVAGLRRGEVAMLAGVSVEYYTRLERRHLAGVSESVLDALAQALRLTRRSAPTCTISRVRRVRPRPGCGDVQHARPCVPRWSG